MSSLIEIMTCSLIITNRFRIDIILWPKQPYNNILFSFFFWKMTVYLDTKSYANEVLDLQRCLNVGLCSEQRVK